MATDVLKLKKAAVAKGMDKDTARAASRADLEAFLAGGRKAPVKKASGAPVKKSTTATRKPAVKKAPARKPVAAKKSAPAKAPVKSTTTKRPATKPTQTDESGRNLLGTLDFNITDGWNPRAGSAVATIFKALKKVRGNVDKAFDILVPNIADFVGPKKQDGTKRTKADRENMLRYRISRTKFDFAIKTMQHEIATARVEYGTGDYATTRAKDRPVKRTTTRKTPARAAAKPNTRRPAAKKTAARKR